MPKKTERDDTGKFTSNAEEGPSLDFSNDREPARPNKLSHYLQLAREHNDLIQSQEDFIATLEDIDDEIFDRTIASMFHLLPPEKMRNPAGQMPIWYKVHFLAEDEEHTVSKMKCVMLYLILELNAHDIHPIPLDADDEITAGSHNPLVRPHSFCLEKEDLFILFGYMDIDTPQPAVGLLLISPGSTNRHHCDASPNTDEEMLNKVLAKMPARVIN